MFGKNKVVSGNFVISNFDVICNCPSCGKKPDFLSFVNRSCPSYGDNIFIKFGCSTCEISVNEQIAFYNGIRISCLISEWNKHVENLIEGINLCKKINKHP